MLTDPKLGPSWKEASREPCCTLSDIYIHHGRNTNSPCVTIFCKISTKCVIFLCVPCSYWESSTRCRRKDSWKSLVLMVSTHTQREREKLKEGGICQKKIEVEVKNCSCVYRKSSNSTRFCFYVSGGANVILIEVVRTLFTHPKSQTRPVTSLQGSEECKERERERKKTLEFNSPSLFFFSLTSYIWKIISWQWTGGNWTLLDTVWLFLPPSLWTFYLSTPLVLWIHSHFSNFMSLHASFSHSHFSVKVFFSDDFVGKAVKVSFVAPCFSHFLFNFSILSVAFSLAPWDRNLEIFQQPW